MGVNSKCGVQSKRRCESHESCICIAGFPACWCQIQGGTKWQHSWRHICDYQTLIFNKDGQKWHELLACCLFCCFFGSISVDKACHASCFDCLLCCEEVVSFFSPWDKRVVKKKFVSSEWVLLYCANTVTKTNLLHMLCPFCGKYKINIQLLHTTTPFWCPSWSSVCVFFMGIVCVWRDLMNVCMILWVCAYDHMCVCSCFAKLCIKLRC